MIGAAAWISVSAWGLGLWTLADAVVTAGVVFPTPVPTASVLPASSSSVRFADTGWTTRTGVAGSRLSPAVECVSGRWGLCVEG